MSKAEPARILVVEREASATRDIVDPLRRYGYVVATADTTAAAIRAAEQEKPDLVLMDVHLPDGADGVRTADHFHRQLGLAVVYLTADADAATMRRALTAAPFGYVVKPFQERDLLIAVEVALERHRAERQLREANLTYVTEQRRAEETLRESEAFLRMSQQAGRCGSWELDLVTNGVKWSDEMCRIHGRAPDAAPATADAAFESVHPEDRSLVVGNAERMMATRESMAISYRILRADNGEERVLWGRGEIVLDEDGQPRRMVGTCVDITEQRRSAVLLERVMQVITPAMGPEFFRSLAQQLAQACEVDYVLVAAVAPNERNQVRSIALCRQGHMLENVTYQLAQTPCENVVGRTLCHYRDHVRGAFPQDKKLAELEVASYMGVPLVSSSGQALGLIALMHSRPLAEPQQAEALLRVVAPRAGAELERERAEAALRDRETLLRGLVETSPLPMLVVTAPPAERIVLMNHRFTEVFGYTPNEVFDVTSWWPRAYPDPEYRARAQRAWNDAVALAAESGQSSIAPVEAEVTCFDGRRRYVETHMGVFGDRGLVVFNDLTERKRAEESLRQSLKMQAIGQLAGGVAHDFNNLLTVILGLSDRVLTALDKADPLRAPLTAIREAGERAALLTRQLLLFGRGAVVEPKVLDLNEVLNRTVGMLARLIGEDVVLDTSLDKALPATRADEGQIEQVIVNLALNARDAMPAGGRLTLETCAVSFSEVECRDHPERRAGRFVQLAVRDTGTGMSPEARDRAFEPFFTTKVPGKGTGLGLATVYGIVQQAEGFISLETSVGQGTCFRVFLPAVEAAPKRLPEDDELVAAGGSETILLVEDEAGVREMAHYALATAGYQVLEASSGKEALDVFDAHSGPIDLLVTDVVMPEMNGRRLADLLSSRRRGLKILFISGYTDDMVDRTLLGTTEAFLQKPFTSLKLARKVREILGRGAE